MAVGPPHLRIPPAQLELLRRNGRREIRSPGVLMQEGWPSDHVLLIEQGLVKITSTTQDGTSKVLALRGANDLVGDFGCVDDTPRSGTVAAMTPITAWKVSAKRFQSLLRSDSALCYSVLRLTVARVRESDGKLGAFGEVSAPDRVIQHLAALACSLAHGAGDKRVRVPVDHIELGASAGVSRATVSRTLRRLVLAGIVQNYRGSIEVIDFPALMDKAG